MLWKLLGTSHDIKSFAIGSFLDGTCIVVERENDCLLQKHLKCWSDYCKTDWFLAKFAQKISSKSAIFFYYFLFLREVYPKICAKILQNLPIFRGFVPENPGTWLFSLRFIRGPDQHTLDYQTRGSVKCRLWTDCVLLLLGLENNGTIVVSFSFAWWK